MTQIFTFTKLEFNVNNVMIPGSPFRPHQSLPFLPQQDPSVLFQLGLGQNQNNNNPPIRFPTPSVQNDNEDSFLQQPIFPTEFSRNKLSEKLIRQNEHSGEKSSPSREELLRNSRERFL